MVGFASALPILRVKYFAIGPHHFILKGLQMTDEEGERSATDPITIGAVFGVLVIVFWLATPFLVKALYSDMTNRGQFGDLFGSINALFSGLAFVGVIIAILLQRQELALQRQELRETRQEMKRTADAQDAAQQALNKTIWAQSYKVALDILEEPNIVTARRTVWKERGIILERKHEDWPQEIKESAELVSRTFESVGTMIKKGLLPSDYLIDTWSMPIAKQWRVLGAYNHILREEWGDPFIAQNFEDLAKEATKFLSDHDVVEIKYIYSHG
jgi:hypothetical protein